jgi:hypothetical protein
MAILAQLSKASATGGPELGGGRCLILAGTLGSGLSPVWRVNDGPFAELPSHLAAGPSQTSEIKPIERRTELSSLIKLDIGIPPPMVR